MRLTRNCVTRAIELVWKGPTGDWLGIGNGSATVGQEISHVHECEISCTWLLDSLAGRLTGKEDVVTVGYEIQRKRISGLVPFSLSQLHFLASQKFVKTYSGLCGLAEDRQLSKHMTYKSICKGQPKQQSFQFHSWSSAGRRHWWSCCLATRPGSRWTPVEQKKDAIEQSRHMGELLSS